MSTILEALRRAEQERQRGTVPTLHGPASVLSATAADHPPRLRPRGVGVLVAVLVLAVAAAAWWLGRLQQADAPLAPAATVAQRAAPPAGAAALPPQPAHLPKAAALPAPSAVASRPPEPAGSLAPPLVSSPKAVAAVPPKATDTGPVFAPADLPASVRADLPSLHLAGITWSGSPRLRMAIVNGQVLHEGDAAAPGLVLQAIEPTRTVWAFRGYRIAFASQ